jgi:hypothetical protein
LEQAGYTPEDKDRGPGLRAVALVASQLRFILIVYGIIFALLGALRLDGSIHGAADGLSGYRADQLSASQDVLDAHGPPLTGLSSNEADNYYPLATDDDRGAFVYIPLLGYAFDTHNLGALLKWIFISFFVLVLFAYPLLLYELTGSLVAALAAPPLLLSHSTFFRTSGIFWVPAWANLFLLPLLLVVAKRWKRSSVWLLVALAVVASLASSVRANAGLGFLLGALFLIVARVPRSRLRLTSVVVIVLAYLSISTFAMNAIQLQRDDVVRHDFTSLYPNGHPVWHNAYIGLGYLKNPYGIRLKDSVAVAAAHKQDPGAVFPTKRYERVLRGLYFRTLRRHPSFVLHEYAVKTGVVMSWALTWFSPMVLLIPLLLLFGKERRTRQFQVALLAGAGIVGAMSGVIVDPSATAQNLSGWYGLLLLLWLMLIGWLARPVELATVSIVRMLAERSAAELGGPVLPRSLVLLRHRVLRLIESAGRLAVGAGRVRWAEHSDLRWRVVARGAIAIALGSAILVAYSSGKSNAAAGTYWADQARLVPREADSGPTVVAWRFGKGVPAGWSASAESVRPDSGGLHLRTRSGEYTHQLDSSGRRLEPGTYVLFVEGRVISGALQLAVVDERGEDSIATRVYWWDQPYAKTRLMAVPFELARATQVRFSFTRFSPYDPDRSSLWSVRSVSVIRQPGGCRVDNPFAWFTPLSGSVPPR